MSLGIKGWGGRVVDVPLESLGGEKYFIGTLCFSRCVEHESSGALKIIALMARQQRNKVVGTAFTFSEFSYSNLVGRFIVG